MSENNQTNINKSIDTQQNKTKLALLYDEKFVGIVKPAKVVKFSEQKYLKKIKCLCGAKQYPDGSLPCGH